ncbi:MAG TPA: hypothetical protein VF647_06155 [Longimicrobium sp.]|jgi:hypothetical protein
MDAPVARPWITVVTGVPRSGTSMMMQMLRAGGMPVATDGVRAPDEDNPRGYLELEAVKELRESDPGALFAGLAGHAVKVVHPLVYRLPAGRPCRVLAMRRDLDEVLGSQEVMLARRGHSAARAGGELRGALEREAGRLQAWLAERGLPVLTLRYDEVVADPEAHARAVDAFLGGGLDVERMAAAVDPALHRRRAPAYR